MPGNVLALTVDEGELVALCSVVASCLQPPACLALAGELGAGKTTFARALIRALMDDPDHEVPSPTFSLRQDYTGATGPIVHIDLYRLAQSGELDEIGFEEASETSITIVEWPDRAADLLPADRIDVFLTESASSEKRDVEIIGRGRAAAVVEAIGKAVARRSG